MVLKGISFPSSAPSPLLYPRVDQSLNWGEGSYPAAQYHVGPLVVCPWAELRVPPSPLRNEVGANQQVLGKEEGTLGKEKQVGAFPGEDCLGGEAEGLSPSAPLE